MERLRAYPMVVLLVPVVLFLLICNYWSWPVNLLRDTECATLDSLCSYAFVVQTEPRDTKKCWRYEAEIVMANRETATGRALIYVLRDSTKAAPQTGDTLVAQTRLHRGDSIDNFDYGLYLRRQGIIGTAFVSRYAILRNQNPAPQPSLQKRLYRRLAAAGLSKDELATTAALTLGYKEDLDPTLRQHFQASGAAHVLAVSGLHTGIIYGLLLWLLTLGGRRKPLYEDRIRRTLLSVVLIGTLWGYAWLTGMTPSVVRCVVMLTIVEIGRILYREAFSVNTIAAAAVLILLARPLDLWNVGFLLSFAATTAIVILARDVERFVHLQKAFENKGLRIVDWTIGTIIISLAAQLGTLPIGMCVFGQVSNYFLLTNLIVLPLATLLVPCGLATIALGGTLVGKSIGYITYGLAWLMNHSVGWIESLPGSVTHVECSLTMVVLLYSALITGWLTIHKSLWWLIGVVGSVTTFCILFAL
jgi:competence protein ComEC